ncbi:MAG: hypothetical protein V5A64_04685, partial [Candidatus Thermoplasmatota archaeon]
MIKKTKLFCIICAGIMLLTFLSPTTVSLQKDEENKKIAIKTNFFTGLGVQKSSEDLTKEEARELTQILMKYDKAMEQNNINQIKKCESWLKEKGILNNNQLKILRLLDRYQCSSSVTSNGNISESNCIFSANGNGFMYFPIENQVIEWIEENAKEQENVIAGFVVILLLAVFFYVPVMLLTHLIPFRIAMPHAQVTLDNGSMNVGDQDVSPPIKVNLTSFTGITISTPKMSFGNESQENNESDESSAFLYVKGYA